VQPLRQPGLVLQQVVRQVVVQVLAQRHLAVVLLQIFCHKQPTGRRHLLRE
jgi:hypothetical protein